MNNWTGSGFISRDIDVKDIQTKAGENMKMARFTVACKRKGKNAGADFISCVAYGKNAENIGKWFAKGKGIEIRGHIQTGSYEGNNGKVYTTDIIVDEWDFPSVRKSDEQAAQPESTDNSQGYEQPQTQSEQQSAPEDEFMNIPDDITDSLPFR